MHVTDDDRDFVDIGILTSDGPKTIVTTAHHLLWDETTRTWTEATDLKIGDQLATPGGGRIDVRAIHRYNAVNRTYNLTVDSVHTYYVVAGNTSVLVHNTNCPVYRTQTLHPESQRLAIDAGGNVSLSGEGRLYLNLSGDASHSLQFRGADGQVVGFDVDRAFVDRVRASALPQRMPRGFAGSRRDWNQLRSTSPEIADPKVSPGLYGIPSNMFDDLRGAIVPGSGRIVG
ncbi:Hint domain-containing protein [Amycolatopsis sp. NPDC058278]|uniref:Hint domain-containing protein n=1 Tax=Amycolatopsis sp. NPDC058278 TaxID=3346417 RepID=UPI0036D7ABA3